MEISKTKEVFNFQLFQEKATLVALLVLKGLELIKKEAQMFSELITATMALEAYKLMSPEQLKFWISRLEQSKSLAVAV